MNTLMSPMLLIVVALIALSLALSATISSQVVVIALLLKFTISNSVIRNSTLKMNK
ncbi:transmembrane protein, putative [Medicago truncatula]|uniref:Transmembrane protein, putative n=1 Tax=Medicago truncatula TaxID=3880 RepID=A0A072VFR1_MEDTR|nr:transmembrane protein, putative [Medicago truncatula]